jgi:translation elongation factor EF-Tu-like GTPase
MNYRQVLQWGSAVTLVMLLLGGCESASPTPIVIVPVATFTAGPPIPAAALPTATVVPPTDIPSTAVTEVSTTDLTSTVEQTATLGTVAATENPSDQPFVMKIDRVSLIVGRGTLLEGRVAHGTLQANSNVEILGPQDKVLSTVVLGVLISNTARAQVTVGDYARILVQNIEPSQVSPGMVLAAAGTFASYEEALQGLQ